MKLSPRHCALVILALSFTSPMLQGSYSWRYYYNQTVPTYSVLPGYTFNGAGL